MIMKCMILFTVFFLFSCSKHKHPMLFQEEKTSSVLVLPVDPYVVSMEVPDHFYDDFIGVEDGGVGDFLANITDSLWRQARPNIVGEANFVFSDSSVKLGERRTYKLDYLVRTVSKINPEYVLSIDTLVFKKVLNVLARDKYGDITNRIPAVVVNFSVIDLKTKSKIFSDKVTVKMESWLYISQWNWYHATKKAIIKIKDILAELERSS